MDTRKAQASAAAHVITYRTLEMRKTRQAPRYLFSCLDFSHISKKLKKKIHFENRVPLLIFTGN